MSETAAQELFFWVPAHGPDPVALERMAREFPKPSNPMGEAWFMASERQMICRIGLFSRSNLCFSLFFPEMQGNRTDADPRRDLRPKVSLIEPETTGGWAAGDGLARTNQPVPRR